MRPIVQTLGAAGVGAWLPMNRIQTPVNISLGVSLSSGASLTYSVQHTFALWDNLLRCSVARTTTAVTVVTESAHNLSVADSVIMTLANYWASIETGSAQTGLDGTYEVATIVSATSFTYTSGTSGTIATTALSANCCPINVFPHAVLVALTASADSNYAFPPSACRLKITTFASGQAKLIVTSGSGSSH